MLMAAEVVGVEMGGEILGKLCVICHGQGPARLEEARLRPVLTGNGGGLVTEGVLEVKHAGKWRHVCSRDWDLSSSRVVCGMLGFPAAEAFNQIAYR